MMPRAKRPDPLLITSVRLTQAQRITLRRLGGSAWLRDYLSKHPAHRQERPAHVA